MITTDLDLRRRLCREQHTFNGRRPPREGARVKVLGRLGSCVWICPFAPTDRPHWHVGPIPAMDDLEHLAEAIRDLTTPTPHDHPERSTR